MWHGILFVLLHAALAVYFPNSLETRDLDIANQPPVRPRSDSLQATIQSAMDVLTQNFNQLNNGSTQSMNELIDQFDNSVEVIAGDLQSYAQPGDNDGYPTWISKLLIQPFANLVSKSTAQMTNDVYSGSFNTTQVNIEAYIRTLGTVSQIVDMYGYDSGPISNAATQLRDAVTWRSSHPEGVRQKTTPSVTISEVFEGPTHSVSGWD